MPAKESQVFAFGQRSRSMLYSCHPDLIRLGEEAIATALFDFSCLEGHRNEESHANLSPSATKVAWKDSKHSLIPSEAVHFGPYPLKFPLPTDSPATAAKKLAKFYMLAQHILYTARRIGVEIRWGGDWDRDFALFDQTFDDLMHFELVRANKT